jgi:FkbM family methyltransferase
VVRTPDDPTARPGRSRSLPLLDTVLSNLFIHWIRAPDHPMKLRLLRYVWVLSGRRWVVCPYLSGTLLRVKPLDYVGYRVISSGAYEIEVLELIRSALPPSGVFVDIGSHVGCFAIPLAKLGHRVLAVDANPDMAVTLRRTAELNRLDTLTAHNIALTNYDGWAEFFVSDGGNSGASSLDLSWVLEAFQERWHRVRVPCSTLATWARSQGLGPIDCVKIDAEGASGKIVRGAADILGRIRTFVIEDSPEIHSAISLLQDSGFEVSQPLNRSQNSETQSTLFAVNREFLG